MPVSEPHAAPDELAEVLRARGLRLTAPRQMVLEAVYSLGHATPDQIHAAVAKRAAGVNITTVYRTLEVLEERGFVRHTHFHESRSQYERTDEPAHQHLICTACGRDQELDLSVLEPLAEDLRRRYGFEAELSHSAIVGVCRTCASHGHSS